MMLKKQTLTKHDFERKKDNREKKNEKSRRSRVSKFPPVRFILGMNIVNKDNN